MVPGRAREVVIGPVFEGKTVRVRQVSFETAIRKASYHNHSLTDLSTLGLVHYASELGALTEKPTSKKANIQHFLAKIKKTFTR